MKLDDNGEVGWKSEVRGLPVRLDQLLKNEEIQFAEHSRRKEVTGLLSVPICFSFSVQSDFNSQTHRFI